MLSQQEGGHLKPLTLSRIRQHCPDAETQNIGPPQFRTTATPAPAVATSPKVVARRGGPTGATTGAASSAKPPATTGKLTEKKNNKQ